MSKARNIQQRYVEPEIDYRAPPVRKYPPLQDFDALTEKYGRPKGRFEQAKPPRQADDDLG